MRLAEVFIRKKASGEKAFVAYLTAGDPTLGATQIYVAALQKAGVDILELGVPHSDPVADGPTNQKAAERALLNGTSLRDILGLVSKLRAGGTAMPVVLFTYFNPIFRMGVEAFATAARRAGVDGVLVVDLPPEEAEIYQALLRQNGIDTIFLASPTTRPERLAAIGRLSSGFVYYVSRTGVTGAQESLSTSLETELELLRSHISLPVCVGFGISTPEQVRAVARCAEGVVVGSALVKCLETEATAEETAKKLGKLAADLVRGLKE